MSHNGNYYSESLKRNTVKSKNITGIFKKMAKRNGDKTENIVSDRDLNAHCSKKDISVPCSSASSVYESEKILLDNDENTPVISEDSVSNQSEVIIKPVHTKNVKDIRVKSRSQYETFFLDFYFSSAKDGWLCKIRTSFSQCHS